MIRWFFILLLLLSMVVALGLFERGRSVQLLGEMKVLDGDTLLYQGEKLRLVGIDAPEGDQACRRGTVKWPCGREAKRALRALVEDGKVRCVTEGIDVYGRSLVRCSRQTKDIAAALVRLGLAISTDDYFEEERQARAERLGLWGGEFEDPADWRRVSREEGTGSQTSIVRQGVDLVRSWWEAIW